MPFAQALHGLEAFVSWSWRPAAQASQARARAGENLPAVQLGPSTQRTHVRIRNEKTEGGRKGMCIFKHTWQNTGVSCAIYKKHTQKKDPPGRGAGQRAVTPRSPSRARLADGV